MDWTLRRLEPGQARPPFDCGDADLNEFFARDSIESGKQLLSVTYVAEIASEAVAFFSVSNDAVRKTDPSRSLWDRLLRQVPREKRYFSMPAVKIGRLATCLTRQSGNIGTELLDYIKVWFTLGNKTGCRFILRQTVGVDLSNMIIERVEALLKLQVEIGAGGACLDNAETNATTWVVIRFPGRNPGSFFTSACSTFRNSRTLPEFTRVAPISCASSLSAPVLN